MTAKALGRVGEADDMHLAVVGSGDVCAAHKAHHVVDEQDVKAAVPGVEKGTDVDDDLHHQVGGVVPGVGAELRAPGRLGGRARHENGLGHQRSAEVGPGPAVPGGTREATLTMPGP